MTTETTNLDKYLHTVRRIEEHREDMAVKQLQKLYKKMIKDLRMKMGNAYADYADPDTGQLTYAQLHKNGLDARLLEEVASNMNDVTQEEKRLIKETVEQTYSNCYSGMVQAVENAAGDMDELQASFASVDAAKAQQLSAAVNNPVHGLTLPEQLEKNRADIIYNIKQAVGVGLSVGDRYDTMARRIQHSLIGPDGAGGSYAKSVRIARTECHRVREQGNLDAAVQLDDKLAPAGFSMMKIWHTMKDEKVRPNKARKTKKGWKYSKGGKYNHVAMEGVAVPINEKFKLPSGTMTDGPGQSGVAGEDINCRCFLSYEMKKNGDEKVEVKYAGGKIITGGKDYKPYDDRNIKDVAASKAYKTFSKTNDISKVAKSSGLKEEEIRQIKRHIFYNKHQLYDNYGTLYPDYDMAVAWKRLSNGKPCERDILLMKHELLESTFEKEYNLSVADAHEKAKAVYDWEKKLMEDLGREGEPYGLL